MEQVGPNLHQPLLKKAVKSVENTPRLAGFSNASLYPYAGLEEQNPLPKTQPRLAWFPIPWVAAMSDLTFSFFE